MIMIKYNENWTFIQRFNCVRDEKEALKVGIVTGVLFFIFTPVFFLPALAAKVILPNLSDPEMSYVALSLKLLPAGIMGILFSSMFAATMSALNAEYNIMAGVITNDVYKRLINPKAKENTLLWVARLTTGLIGMIMILGAVYIKYFGGAFEANKLFTGILAIPIGVPLLLGILYKKPNSISSILTIILGVISGVVLNAVPGISWELATIIETAFCLLIYFVPAIFMKEALAQTEKTEAFFTKLNTPLTEAEKPTISAESRKSMLGLFIISALVAGALFISMSIPSINIYSGQLSFASGVFCLIVGFVLWLISRKK
jgi:Na+/proline symporter